MKIPASVAYTAPASAGADALADRLRADAAPPEFSPLLHERVMAHLRAKGGIAPQHDPLQAMDRRARSGFVPWRRVLWVGAATAAAAAIVAAVWFNMQPPATPTKAIPMAADSAIPSLPAFPVTQPPVTDVLESVRFANLDKDAQRLAIFVADQIPSFGLPKDP